MTEALRAYGFPILEWISIFWLFRRYSRRYDTDHVDEGDVQEHSRSDDEHPRLCFSEILSQRYAEIETDERSRSRHQLEERHLRRRPTGRQHDSHVTWKYNCWRFRDVTSKKFKKLFIAVLTTF